MANPERSESQPRTRWQIVTRRVQYFGFVLILISLIMPGISASQRETTPASAIVQPPIAQIDGAASAIEATVAAQLEARTQASPTATQRPPSATSAPTQRPAEPTRTAPPPSETSRPAEQPAQEAEQPAQEQEFVAALSAPLEEQSAPSYPTNALIDGWRFTTEPGLTTSALQALLNSYPGPLKTATISAGPYVYSFAETLVAQSSLYSVNPKVVLALLEMRLGMLSNPAADTSTIGTSLRWILHELYQGQYNAPSATQLRFLEGLTAPIPPGVAGASYAILRVLALAETPDRLGWLLSEEPGSFIDTYRRLFGDPRAPVEVPQPSAPFLTYPKAVRSQVTSYFDHEYPFLKQNGSIVSYLGLRDRRLGYDGHTGWDYGGRMGGQLIAAASGIVLFAGFSEDGCLNPAGAVVIDHGNNYRTLYWHMATVDVQTGQQVERGQNLGLVGGSGCASGPHLHFQVSFAGRVVDPYGWCGELGSDPWAQHPFGMPSTWLWADRPNVCGLPSNATLVRAGGEGFSASRGWVIEQQAVQGGAAWIVSDQQPGAGLAEHIGERLGLENTHERYLNVLTELGETAIWQANLPAAGRYRVLTFVPYIHDDAPESRSVRYTVRSAEGLIEVEVDQALMINDWVDLGTYAFDQQALVSLSNRTGVAGEDVWAGAMLWLPAE